MWGASELWPQGDDIPGPLTPQARLIGLGERSPHSLPWLKEFPKRRRPNSYKYCLDSAQGAEGGTELRASEGVPRTPGLGAADLQAEPLRWCEGSSVGTGSRGYGLMFQAGHLGASLRSPGDPGAEGLSPWADKALQNGGRGGCGPGSQAQAGVGGVEDGAQRGSGTCGDERLARQTLKWLEPGCCREPTGHQDRHGGPRRRDREQESTSDGRLRLTGLRGSRSRVPGRPAWVGGPCAGLVLVPCCNLGDQTFLAGVPTVGLWGLRQAH